MANETLSKELVLHGIGKGLLKSVTGKVLAVKHAQNLTFSVTTSDEDVYGGDGLFPIFNYITQKEGSFEVTNATFSLAQIAMLQGSENVTSGNKRMGTAIIKSDSDKLGDGLTGVEVQSVIDPEGKMVTLDTSSSGSGLFIDDDGTITGASTVLTDGEYTVFYTHDDTKAVKSMMLKTAMPEVCELFWTFESEALDGVKYQIDIHASRVRANGELSMETGRDSASTPSLKFKVLDPGDSKKSFCEVTVTPLN